MAELEEHDEEHCCSLRMFYLVLVIDEMLEDRGKRILPRMPARCLPNFLTNILIDLHINGKIIICIKIHHNIYNDTQYSAKLLILN